MKASKPIESAVTYRRMISHMKNETAAIKLFSPKLLAKWKNKNPYCYIKMKGIAFDISGEKFFEFKKLFHQIILEKPTIYIGNIFTIVNTCKLGNFRYELYEMGGQKINFGEKDRLNIIQLLRKVEIRLERPNIQLILNNTRSV